MNVEHIDKTKVGWTVELDGIDPLVSLRAAEQVHALRARLRFARSALQGPIFATRAPRNLLGCFIDVERTRSCQAKHYVTQDASSKGDSNNGKPIDNVSIEGRYIDGRPIDGNPIKARPFDPQPFEKSRLKLHRRRRLARRLLRPLPRRANVHRYPVIKWFAQRAKRYPFLWSFGRAQVLPALYAGMVLSLSPLYGLQILLAFALALLLRANLTITVGLQMIVNPLTIAPIYGGTAWLGSWLMTLAGVGAELPRALFLANALFVGGAVAGLALAMVAHLGWRLAAWEARVFRARFELLRQHANEHAKTNLDAAYRSHFD